MAARLKAKLRTRVGGSAKVAAARGKQARAHRQKAARASEGHTPMCAATKGAAAPMPVTTENVAVHPSCKCCASSAFAVAPGDMTPPQAAEPVASAASVLHTAVVTEFSIDTSFSGSVPEPAAANGGTTTTATTIAAPATAAATAPTASTASVKPATQSEAPPTTANITGGNYPKSAASAPHSAQTTTPPAGTAASLQTEAPVKSLQESRPDVDCATEQAASGSHSVAPACTESSDKGPALRIRTAPCSSTAKPSTVPPSATPPAVDNSGLFPTTEDISCAAGSILTSIVANYVITAVPVLMQTVFGQLTHDQVAQLLPVLACSSGIVAVLSGQPPRDSADSRTASQLLEVSEKRHPTMTIPADLAEAIEHDTHHARYAAYILDRWVLYMYS